MEANPKTALRFVAVLCMFALSLGASPSPQKKNFQEYNPKSLPIDKKTLKCVKTSALDCSKTLLNPAAYSGCFTPRMTTCKAQPSADPKANAGGNQPINVPLFDCTQKCVEAMSKVMTINAKVEMGEEATSAKPSEAEPKRYAEGYVDFCYHSCSKENKINQLIH